jgi:hypothetical protein
MDGSTQIFAAKTYHTDYYPSLTQPLEQCYAKTLADGGDGGNGRDALFDGVLKEAGAGVCA